MQTSEEEGSVSYCLDPLFVSFFFLYIFHRIDFENLFGNIAWEREDDFGASEWFYS